MPTRVEKQNIEDSELKAGITAVNISQSGNSFHMAIFVTPRNNDIMRVRIFGISIHREEGNKADNKEITLPGGTPHITIDIGGNERKKEYEVSFELSRDDYDSLLRSRKVRMGIMADDGPVVMGIYQVKVKNE